MPKDVQLSEAVQKQINARPNECWRNAILALFSTPALEGAVYVEGWCVAFFSFEHGWLELPDGTIIDPTITEDDMQYFPGVKYTLEELEKRIKKHSLNLPLVRYDFKRGGMENIEYSKAHSKALLSCF